MFYSLYFSPTGGAKIVAECLAAAWDEKRVIDLSNPETEFEWYRFEKTDRCLITISVYGGRVPPVAAHRLSVMQANQTPCAIAVVCGDRDFGGALYELRQGVLSCGFIPVVAVSAVAECILFCDTAPKRPDMKDMEELRQISRKLKNKLETDDEVVQVPGENKELRPHLKPILPQLDMKKCTQCMICAQLCPTKAICFENPGSLYRNSCIGCMRCVAVCPVNARYVDKNQIDCYEEYAADKSTERKPNCFYK